MATNFDTTLRLGRLVRAVSVVSDAMEEHRRNGATTPHLRAWVKLITLLLAPRLIGGSVVHVDAYAPLAHHLHRHRGTLSDPVWLALTGSAGLVERRVEDGAEARLGPLAVEVRLRHRMFEHFETALRNPTDSF